MNPSGSYLLKVNIGNTGTKFEICSKFSKNTSRVKISEYKNVSEYKNFAVYEKVSKYMKIPGYKISSECKTSSEY